MTTKKFFTWVEQEFERQDDVPVRWRRYMRFLWLHGARLEDVARTFKLPAEWVDDFVHERDEEDTRH